MEANSWWVAGQALTYVIAVIGAVGVLVQIILQVIQMKRERLEIQKLERHSDDHPNTDE